jgi:hypothetical protein
MFCHGSTSLTTSQYLLAYFDYALRLSLSVPLSTSRSKLSCQNNFFALLCHGWRCAYPWLPTFFPYGKIPVIVALLSFFKGHTSQYDIFLVLRQTRGINKTEGLTRQIIYFNLVPEKYPYFIHTLKFSLG